MNKTIFMIHGMWCKSTFWDNYIKYFENQGFTCIAKTLPEHKSCEQRKNPHRISTLSLQDYVEFLKIELLKLDDKPIIMAHSMGGVLALKLCELGLAKAAILISTAAPHGIFALKYSVLKSFSHVLITWKFWQKPQKPRFKSSCYSMLNCLDSEEQRKTYDSFVFESGKVTFQIGYWFWDKSRESEVKGIRSDIPILIISGKEDKITPSSIARKIAKKFNTDYLEYRNHSHFLTKERGWESIATDILNWINKKVE